MSFFLPYVAFPQHTMHRLATSVAITSWMADFASTGSTRTMRASSMRKAKPPFVGYIA
jgi:hypothetical protein